MSTRNPDPLAVIVAESLHQRYRPLAAILFGSRARGGHHENSSDLDILLVTREEADIQEQGEVQRDALRRAMRTYGREAPINLSWVTGEQLEHEGQYVNFSPMRAMLEGVVFSGHPERYRSRYDAVDPPTPRYNWSTYNAYLASAREGLDAMIIVLQGHGGGAGRRISSMMPEIMVRLLRQLPPNEESVQPLRPRGPPGRPQGSYRGRRGGTEEPRSPNGTGGRTGKARSRRGPGHRHTAGGVREV